MENTRERHNQQPRYQLSEEKKNHHGSQKERTKLYLLKVESARTEIDRDRCNSRSKKNLKKNLFRPKKKKSRTKRSLLLVWNIEFTRIWCRRKTHIERRTCVLSTTVRFTFVDCIGQWTMRIVVIWRETSPIIADGTF